MEERDQHIKSILKREEGFVSHVYQDHLGYWTIGYGKMVDKRKGGGITEEQALRIMMDDVDTIEDELDRQIDWFWELDPVRQAVLVCMAYQMGVPGLLRFRNTLLNIKAGNYAQAAKGMRASLWAQQTPGRAERMVKAMETGEL